MDEVKFWLYIGYFIKYTKGMIIYGSKRLDVTLTQYQIQCIILSISLVSYPSLIVLSNIMEKALPDELQDTLMYVQQANLESKKKKAQAAVAAAATAAIAAAASPIHVCFT